MTSSGNTVNYYFHLRKKVYKIIGQDISKLPGRSVPASHQFNNPLDSFQGWRISVCLGIVFFFFFCFRTFLVCLLNSGAFQLFVSIIKSWNFSENEVQLQVFSQQWDKMCILSLNSPLPIKPLQGNMVICTHSLFIVKISTPLKYKSSST